MVAVLILAREPRVFFLSDDRVFVTLADEAFTGVHVLHAERELRVVLTSGHLVDGSVVLLHADGRGSEQRRIRHSVGAIVARLVTARHVLLLWLRRLPLLVLLVANAELAEAARRMVHSGRGLGFIRAELSLRLRHLACHILLPARARVVEVHLNYQILQLSPFH